MTDFETFDRIVRSRRAIRHFKPEPLPEGLLEKLLDCANWAPSGYNLQPVHFLVVTDAALKKPLRRACMDQAQVEEAPATVIFTGDRNVARNNFEAALRLDKEAGAVDDRYEKVLRKYVPLAFRRGPLWFNQIGKTVFAPLMGIVTPTPEIPAVNMRYWLNRQVALSAMTFMHAATAAGLASCPMEGFDERRLRRLLAIPRTHIIPIIVPIGFPVEGDYRKTRLPLRTKLHTNSW